MWTSLGGMVHIQMLVKLVLPRLMDKCLTRTLESARMTSCQKNFSQCIRPTLQHSLMVGLWMEELFRLWMGILFKLWLVGLWLDLLFKLWAPPRMVLQMGVLLRLWLEILFRLWMMGLRHLRYTADLRLMGLFKLLLGILFILWLVELWLLHFQTDLRLLQPFILWLGLLFILWMQLPLPPYTTHSGARWTGDSCLEQPDDRHLMSMVPPTPVMPAAIFTMASQPASTPPTLQSAMLPSSRMTTDKNGKTTALLSALRAAHLTLYSSSEEAMQESANHVSSRNPSRTHLNTRTHLHTCQIRAPLAAPSSTPTRDTTFRMVPPPTGATSATTSSMTSPSKTASHNRNSRTRALPVTPNGSRLLTPSKCQPMTLGNALLQATRCVLQHLEQPIPPAPARKPCGCRNGSACPECNPALFSPPSALPHCEVCGKSQPCGNGSPVLGCKSLPKKQQRTIQQVVQQQWKALDHDPHAAQDAPHDAPTDSYPPCQQCQATFRPCRCYQPCEITVDSQESQEYPPTQPRSIPDDLTQSLEQTIDQHNQQHNSQQASSQQPEPSPTLPWSPKFTPEQPSSASSHPRPAQRHPTSPRMDNIEQANLQVNLAASRAAAAAHATATQRHQQDPKPRPAPQELSPTRASRRTLSEDSPPRRHQQARRAYSQPRTQSDDEEEELRPPVSPIPIAKMLNELRNELTNHTTTTVETFITRFADQNAKRHTRTEANVQQNTIDIETNRQENRQLRVRQDHLEKTMLDVQKQLVLAKFTPNTADLLDTDLDRAPDPSLVRLNCELMVSLQSITDTVTAWLRNINLQEGDDWQIRGGPQPLSKNWTIFFNADPGIAARRAKKALQVLRKPDGTYQQLQARAPDSTYARVYASPDKNLRQILRESATKKFKKIVEPMVPREEIFALKKDGVVTIGWQKLALLKPADDKTINLQFNNEIIVKYKLDKNVIRQKFEAAWAATSTAEVEWSL